MARIAVRLGVAVLVVWVPLLSGARDLETPACRRIEQSLEALSPLLRSSCMVTGMKGGAKATLLLVASGKPSASSKAWRAYMSFACVAVGERLNAVRGLQLNEVWLTDAETVAKGQAFALSAGDCQRWQSQVHAGQRDMQGLASAVEQAARPVSVAR